VRELRFMDGEKTVQLHIEELYKNAWIDRSTRAVFIELAVYNPRLHILCVIK